MHRDTFTDWAHSARQLITAHDAKRRRMAAIDEELHKVKEQQARFQEDRAELAQQTQTQVATTIATATVAEVLVRC